ncbi:MAG: RNA-directed DNA polymerase [Sedimentisphaerales bacterium]|nr:RNA-directed DNA polymerase [Sedimentisphaerales bacterium]
MDDIKKFKQYFNRDFWRAFQKKQNLFDIPKNKSDKDSFVETIYQEIQKRTYYPSIPHCYIDRDKGNGVTRIIPVFTLKDYCVYYYCIKKIEDKIAVNRIPNTFGGWTLGGLMRKSEDDELEKRRIHFKKHEDFIAALRGISVSEYSFNPTAWAKAYGDLNSKLYATANTIKYTYVVELDIANYYDSIRLDILEMRIREVVSSEHADIVSLLFHFLNYWNRNTNFYNKQTVGIPQDAMGDCSRILANFYLQPYDKIVYELCKQSECKYLRYADDQFFFSKDKNNLNTLIYKISKTLNSLGLSVNQKKVVIRTTIELIDYRSFKIFDILKKDEYKKDKNKVEQFVDYYLQLLAKSGLSNIKDNGTPLLNKALFCPSLKDIDFFKKQKLISCLLDDEYLRNAQAIHLEKIYKLLNKNDKQKFINKLNLLSAKLIHNAFHYELLNFYVKNKIDDHLVLKRIKKLSKI